MILHNVQIVGETGLKEIWLQEGKIVSINDSRPFLEDQSNEPVIELTNALAFPGLINSHDHLDFNLFPPLGNCVYNNYTEWGKDIHDNNKEIIDAILKIPLVLRVQWGVYKNLLNGVTTVVNHGGKLNVKDELISVFQECRSLHSIAFEKNWKYKLNSLHRENKPYVMHIGEGTDAEAQQEINTLVKWNLFKRKIIGVHAVAMDEKEAAHFKAIVWCPVSNLYLLSKTASIKKLKKRTKIVFGTDATLTAGWNIWNHLRLARSFHMMNDAELFASVTETAAEVWGLETGKLKAHLAADIIVAANKGRSNTMNTFYSLNPEDILLVIKAGKIVLFAECLQQQLYNQQLIQGKFSEISMAMKKKYVAGDLPALIAAINQYHPGIQFPFD